MKRTLSDIICQNTDGIQALPPNAFRLDEAPLDCSDSSRSQLDFEAFAEVILGNNHQPQQQPSASQEPNANYISTTTEDIHYANITEETTYHNYTTTDDPTKDIYL